MNDRDTRHRLQSELGRNAAVSAGAGSGKTTVLVDRLVGLLARGTDPSRIAAVTFTEAAAGEIALRLRDRVEERRRGSAILEAAARRLGDLRVHTLHSFCARLLEAEALAARWAPGSVPGPPGPAGRQAYASWRAGLRRRNPVAARLLASRASDRTIRTFFHRAVDLRSQSLVRAGTLDVDASRAAIRAIADEMATVMRACRDSSDALYLAAVAWRTALFSALGQADAVTGLLGALDLGPPKWGNRGQASAWPDRTKPRMKEIAVAVESWADGVGSDLHAAVLDDLVAHGIDATVGLRQATGERSFQDLLIGARDLLVHDAAARARLASRFDALLIDEVQDTDPVQAEVALLLTRRSDLDGPWTDHPPEDGRLFAVGDARQAIYSFREADVATWERLAEVVARGGDRASLTTCFRSVPGIVDFVNRAFQNLSGYEPLQAFRAAAGPLDPVVVLHTEKTDACTVVNYIAQLQRDHGVRLSDILVLLPSWTRAPDLRAAFARAGLPMVTEGPDAFYQRDEIRLCLAGLAAVDEPADAEAVVFALRGLFGCSTAALARHIAAGGSWRHTAPGQPEGPVADALGVLSDLHRRRARVRMAATLDALLDRSRAAESWALRPDGPSRLATVDRLRDLLRQAEATSEDASDRTFGEAIAALRAPAWAKEEGTDETIGLGDPEHDAVRVTTIYRAKGREARVAILFAAHREPRPGEVVTDAASSSTRIRIGKNLAPPDWASAVARRRAALAEEFRRLVYVGSTRARDQLVVACPARERQSLLGDLRPHLPSGPHGALVAGVRVLHAAHLEPAPDVDRTVPDAGREPETGGFSARLVQDVATARRASMRRRSVTEAVADDESAAGSGIGRVGGVAVHDVMRRLDLGADVPVAEIDRRVAEAAARHALDAPTAAAVRQVVAQLLTHDIVRAARAAPYRLVEAPFAFVDRGTEVRGVIDLAFPSDATGSHWTVVDWKSDLPAEGSALRNRYAKQLQLYARALLATAGCATVDTVLGGPHTALAEAEEWTDVDADGDGEEAPRLERDPQDESTAG